MVTPDRPYLKCKYGECHQPIWLPQSSQLHISEDQFGWNDNLLFCSEIYVCPGCGHVYEYTRRDVHRSPAQDADRDQPPRPHELLATIGCGTENCEFQIVIRKPTFEYPDNVTKKLEAFAQGSKAWILHDIHCPKLHSLTELPPLRASDVQLKW
jgi:hypothetical protein